MAAGTTSHLGREFEKINCDLLTFFVHSCNPFPGPDMLKQFIVQSVQIKDMKS